MENFSSDINEIFMQRLKSKGIDSLVIVRFIKDLTYAFTNNHEISPIELESYLRQMGWDEFNVDYHTYQLAKAFYENGDLKMRMIKWEIEDQKRVAVKRL